jgi:hypothetical protein
MGRERDRGVAASGGVAEGRRQGVVLLRGESLDGVG